MANITVTTDIDNLLKSTSAGSGTTIKSYKAALTDLGAATITSGTIAANISGNAATASSLTGGVIANITNNTLPLAKISTANAPDNFVLTSQGPDVPPAWEIIPPTGGGLLADGTQATLRTARVSGYNRIVNPSIDAWRIQNKLLSQKKIGANANYGSQKFRISVFGDSVAADPGSFAQGFFGKGGIDVHPTPGFFLEPGRGQFLSLDTTYANWTTGQFNLYDVYARTTTGRIHYLDQSITSGRELFYSNVLQVLCHTYVVRYLSGPTTGGGTGDLSYGKFKLQYRVNPTDSYTGVSTSFSDCILTTTSTGGGVVSVALSGATGTNASLINNELIALPTISFSRQSYSYTSGANVVTMSYAPSNVWQVFVNGSPHFTASSVDSVTGWPTAFTAVSGSGATGTLTAQTPSVNTNSGAAERVSQAVFYLPKTDRYEFRLVCTSGRVRITQAILNDGGMAINGASEYNDNGSISFYHALSGRALNNAFQYIPQSVFNDVLGFDDPHIIVYKNLNNYGVNVYQEFWPAFAARIMSAAPNALFIVCGSHTAGASSYHYDAGNLDTDDYLANWCANKQGAVFIDIRQNYPSHNGTILLSGATGTYANLINNDLVANELTLVGGKQSYSFTNSLGTVTMQWNGTNWVVAVDGITQFTSTAISGAGWPPTGSGAVAGTVTRNGSNAITAIAVGDGGTFYSVAPSVVITGGGGSGAAATAVITNGAVTGVNVTSGGINYTSTPTVEFLTFTPSSGATGTLVYSDYGNSVRGIDDLSADGVHIGGIGADYVNSLIWEKIRPACEASINSVENLNVGIIKAPFGFNQIDLTVRDNRTSTYNNQTNILSIKTDPQFTSKFVTRPSNAYATGGGYTEGGGFEVSQNITNTYDAPATALTLISGGVNTMRFGISKNRGYSGAIIGNQCTAGRSASGLRVLQPTQVYGNNPPSMVVEGIVNLPTTTRIFGIDVNATNQAEGIPVYSWHTDHTEFHGAQGSGATATAVLSGSTVGSINVTNKGHSYLVAPMIAITGGGGTNASYTATVSGGKITGFVMVNAGTGYTTAPTVVITPALPSATDNTAISFTTEAPTTNVAIHTPISATEGSGDLKRVIGVIPSYVDANTAANVAALGVGEAYYDEATKKVKVKLP